MSTPNENHTWAADGFCLYCHNVHRTDHNARSTCSDGFKCSKGAPQPQPSQGDSVAIAFIKLAQAHDEILAQRDELLTVATRFLNLSDHPYISGQESLPAWAETQDQARAAIARATERRGK